METNNFIYIASVAVAILFVFFKLKENKNIKNISGKILKKEDAEPLWI